MEEKQKNIRESELLPAAVEKCRELMTSVIEAESDDPTIATDNAPDRIKSDARLLGIAELTRWKQNAAAEESIIAELYPEEDPKFYFRTLEYVLRHFDTLFEAVAKSWMKQNGKESPFHSQKGIAPTSRKIHDQIDNTLS